MLRTKENVTAKKKKKETLRKTRTVDKKRRVENNKVKAKENTKQK